MEHEHPHDHEHSGHEHGEGRDIPHEPAPPGPRRLIPEPAMLPRGIGLAVLAGGLFWAGWRAAAKSWALAPAAVALGIAGALSAWAAAIHLTGGERFDDHPFV
ncbi:MAG: hypothetical protein AMXMBFR80_04250 [Dehalococcoidia bacterium]